MFDTVKIRDSRSIWVVKKLFLAAVAGYVVIGLTAGHRAFFQVRSLQLHARSYLSDGSTVRAYVVSSGRTFVDVHLELVQQSHTETIAVRRVGNNEFAFFDPRSRETSFDFSLQPELLARFNPGPAQLRLIAYGRPQLTRTPPPVSREVTVEITHN